MEKFGKERFLPKAGESMVEDQLELNEIVAVSIDTISSISIHFAASDKPAGENITLIRSGFRKLARLLANDERLSTISTVAITSPLVKERPRAFQGFGFSVDESGKDPLGTELKRKYAGADAKTMRERALGLLGVNIHDGFASVSKGEFLRRYGDSFDKSE